MGEIWVKQEILLIGLTDWAIAESVRRFAHSLVPRPENGMSVNLNIPITSIPAPIPPNFLNTAIGFLSRFWGNFDNQFAGIAAIK
jgi:hypothetical protein